jgi:pentose-5-phosphate-3-epimerase
MPKNINKKHNFQHLERAYKNTNQKTADSIDIDVKGNKFLDSIPMGKLIINDLKRSTVLITVVVLFVVLLGVVIYKTDLLSPILEKFSLNY